MGKETAIFITTCQVKSHFGTPLSDVLNNDTNIILPLPNFSHC